MKRSDLIQLITVNVADGDAQHASKLFAQNLGKISWPVYLKAVRRGMEIRAKIEAGMTSYDAFRTTTTD